MKGNGLVAGQGLLTGVEKIPQENHQHKIEDLR